MTALADATPLEHIAGVATLNGLTYVEHREWSVCDCTTGHHAVPGWASRRFAVEYARQHPGGHYLTRTVITLITPIEVHP